MRSKIDRYAYNEQAENILQPGKPLYEKVKGNWAPSFFKNNNPVVLELACGRGEYTVGLAKEFADLNFLGVDIKGDRLYIGSSTAYQHKLQNAGFLRAFIHDLDFFFAEKEVFEIWLTFPDPRPKDKDEGRRLTMSRFVELYKKILQPGGWLKLKTDSTSLFQYTLDCFKERGDIYDLSYTWDLNNSDMLAEHHGITTHYEQLFSKKGEKIKYLKCKLT